MNRGSPDFPVRAGDLDAPRFNEAPIHESGKSGSTADDKRQAFRLQ